MLRFARKIPITQTLTAVILTIGVIVVLFPVLWMIFGSMRSIPETFGTPPSWFPKEFKWDAYLKLIGDPTDSNMFGRSGGKQLRYQMNTYIIALSTAFVSISLGSLAAYGFSRFRIRGGGGILLAIMALQMLPGVSLIIPFYNLANWAGIYDTYWAVIIADTVFALPISIWMLKSYVDSIPVDLEEAAMVDGANRLQALYKVVMPLMLPGLVGTATFAFLYGWNDFVFASILTDGPHLAPMTVALQFYFTQLGREWNLIMALNTLATIPLFVIFVFLQRYVIQGMTAGAVK